MRVALHWRADIPGTARIDLKSAIEKMRRESELVVQDGG